MSDPLPKTFLALDPLPDMVAEEARAHTAFIQATPETLGALVEQHGASVEILASRGKQPVGRDLLDRLPRLRLIAAYGVGYDKVDAAAAVERGVLVTNTPDVLSDDVADLAVALLLATVRRLPQADRFVRSGAWAKGAYPLTSTLRDRTVGLVGMGRIGQEIAARLAAFRIPIAYHSRTPASVPYRHFPDLLDLARHVDALVVIVPGGKATEKMIGAPVLEALGPKGIVVNVARGSVMDQDALIAALRDGAIEAAGLDVYEGEPIVPAELAAMDNVVLLPHVGSGTHFTRDAMNRLFLDNVLGWAADGRVVTPVRECLALTSP